MTIEKFVSRRVMEILLLTGPGLLLLACGWSIRNTFVLHRGVNTSGTVIDIVPKSTGSDPFYETTFTFKAKDGRMYKVTPEVMERPAPYSIGDNISVVYNPNDPYEASISSHAYMWRFPEAFGFGGAIATAIGLLLWRKNRATYLSDSDADEQPSYEQV